MSLLRTLIGNGNFSYYCAKCHRLWMGFDCQTNAVEFGARHNQLHVTFTKMRNQGLPLDLKSE